MGVLVLLDKKSISKGPSWLMKSGSGFGDMQSLLASIIAKAGFEGVFEIKYIESVPGSPHQQGKIVFGVHRRFYIEFRCQPGNNSTHMKMLLATPTGFQAEDFKSRLVVAQELMAKEAVGRSQNATTQNSDLVAIRTLAAHSKNGPIHIKLVSSRETLLPIKEATPEPKMSIGNLLARLEKMKNLLSAAERAGARIPTIDARLREIQSLFVSLSDEQAKLIAEKSDIMANQSELVDIGDVAKEVESLEGRIQKAQT